MPAGYIESDRRKLLQQLVKKDQAARHELDVAIMEAVEAGISRSVIGKIVGMSHSSVGDRARRKRQELDGKKKTTRRAETVPGRRAPPLPPRHGWSDPPPPGWEQVPPKRPPHNS